MTRLENPTRRPRPIALVADDEPLIGATLVEILQDDGYDALCVSDGESAWFWAREIRPDFLISDVMMPRMSGIEVARLVLAEIPQTRVILFSGQAGSPELLEQARAEGLQCEVLFKPIKPDQLLAKMRVRPQ